MILLEMNITVPKTLLGVLVLRARPERKTGPLIFLGPHTGPNLPDHPWTILRAFATRIWSSHLWNLIQNGDLKVDPKWSPRRVPGRAAGRVPRGGLGGARQVPEGTALSNKPNSQLTAPRCRLGDRTSK